MSFSVYPKMLYPCTADANCEKSDLKKRTKNIKEKKKKKTLIKENLTPTPHITDTPQKALDLRSSSGSLGSSVKSTKN